MLGASTGGEEEEGEEGHIVREEQVLVDKIVRGEEQG